MKIRQIGGGPADYFYQKIYAEAKISNSSIFFPAGWCYERIHDYIEISFCVPPKVFRRLNPYLIVEPESIFNCLEALRPYHGMSLLYEERELLDKFPLDASPTLKKLIRYSSPMKSFRTLASDADIALRHVRKKTYTYLSELSDEKSPLGVLL
jgi:hypothetical protein